MKALIASLPGDGIGPEVMAAALEALQTIAQIYGHQFNIVSASIGGAAIDRTGSPLPEATRELCQQADAVLLGAVGGPQWNQCEPSQRPEAGLLALRQAMAVYANLRPITTHPRASLSSPIKAEYLAGVDLIVVRELTGGLYFGEKQEGEHQASDLCTYHDWEIERLVHRAAKMALQRRGRLCLVDKANVLATSRLWRRVTETVIAQHYPQLKLEILLVDAAAMHLISRPNQFDVIMTENLFGDILTDEASMLAGSMGLLPSASLGDSHRGLYEPIHGSAPDIAGKNCANPCGMVLSAALALRYSLGLAFEAEQIEAAVKHCLDHHLCTRDLGGQLNTSEMGEAICQQIRAQSQAEITSNSVEKNNVHAA